MTHDTTIVDVVDPHRQPSLPRSIAAREIHLERIMPAISVGALWMTILLCAVFLAVSLFPLHHTDLWGHMALARAAADSSITSPLLADVTTTATNTAWLGQQLLLKVFDYTGFEGLQLTHALLATVAVGLLILATKLRGVSMGVALSAGLISFIIMLPVVGVMRPQLFGLVAMPLVLCGLTTIDNGRRHALVWLPPVFLLWANLHGSFVVGLVALGCLALSRSWQSRSTGASWQEVLRLDNAGTAWLAVVLSTAACCVHPEGPGVVWQAVSFGNSPNLTMIAEWQPLQIKSLSGVLFFASLAITAVLLRRSSRTIQPHKCLLLAVLAIGTLMAIRMLVWWAIVWPWVVAPHCAACCVSLRDYKVDRPIVTPVYTLIATVALLLALVWSPASYALITGESRPATEALTDETPTFLANEVNRLKLAGRALVPMQWGDYLAFESAGRLQPIVHSHVHLISPGVLRDYRRVMTGHPNWLRILDHHNVEYLVVRDLYNHANGEQLVNHPRLHTVYRDQQGAIFRIVPADRHASHTAGGVQQVEHAATGVTERVQAHEQESETSR
ncbi:MAG: hypothetical protein MI757_08995 [Pirellulales bacterium]|nr:hypothetical protein [Pirellulales bacterium]